MTDEIHDPIGRVHADLAAALARADRAETLLDKVHRIAWDATDGTAVSPTAISPTAALHAIQAVIEAAYEDTADPGKE